MKFTELQLNEQLLESMSYMGFETATPIQAEAIPLILKGKDLIACAQTGTGKTGAFVLPILNKLVNGNKKQHLNTMIIVPTRELALQIEQQIEGLSYFLDVSAKAVYGGGDGKDWDEQKRALEKGADIIVATPGKLLAHLQMGYVNCSEVEHLILDEADRMLDMGFIHDIQKIISYLPKERQTLMFSATMPGSIKDLAKKTLHDPGEIYLAVSKTAEGVNQCAYLCFDGQKIDTLRHLLSEREEYDSIIVFTSMKARVGEIVRSLNKHGLKSKGISSNLDQQQREEVLAGFRSKRIRILVATDVMSRGIDIKEINMVVNFDVPPHAEDYVHRVGRTARVGTKGEAVTLINPKDMYGFAKIESLIDTTVEKLNPPEELGKGPEWRPDKPKGKGPGKGRGGNGSQRSQHHRKGSYRGNQSRNGGGSGHGKHGRYGKRNGGKNHGGRNQGSGGNNKGGRNQGAGEGSREGQRQDHN